MVGVDQELDSGVGASRGELIEARNDAAGLEEDRRDEDRARPFVESGGHPLGQRADRLRLEADDLEARLVQPRELSAERVNSASDVISRGRRRRSSAERKRMTSSCVFWPSATSAPGSPRSRRNPFRTSSAFANARSHFSSTCCAASSNASS